MIRNLIYILILFTCFQVNAQPHQSIFTNLEDAFKQPLQVKELILSNQGIHILPEEVIVFKNLEKLNLEGNDLIKLPKAIAQLTKLKQIVLSNNPNLHTLVAFEILSKLTNLEILYLNDCNLLYLPYQIRDLRKLKELHLSENSIRFLPKEIRNLQQLETLDISFNELENFVSEFIYLEKLTTLDLSFNPHLNYEECLSVLSEVNSLQVLKLQGIAFIPKQIGYLYNLRSLDLSYADFAEIPGQFTKLDQLEDLVLVSPINVDYGKLFSKLSALNNLKYLIIFDDNIKELPNGLGRIYSLQKLFLRGNMLEYISKDISNLEHLESIEISMSPRLSLEELIRNVVQIKSLKELSILYSNLGFLPANLEELTQLYRLDLKGNSLTSIPFLVTKLNLGYLNIEDNPMERITIEDLKSKMPDCIIEHDHFDAKEKIANLHESIISEPELFIVKAEQPNTIFTRNKHIITIPQLTFIDQDGNPVNGEISVIFEDFSHLIPLVCENLNYTYDSSGKAYLLSFRHAFSLKAYQNSAPLFVHPESFISVDLLSDHADSSNHIFYYDSYLQKWVIKGKDMIQKTEINDEISYEAETPVYPPNTLPDIYFETIYFKYLTPFTSKNFKFKIKVSYKGLSANYYKDDIKAYPEIRQLKKIRWIYDGKDAKNDFQNFKNIIRRTIKYERYKIYDVRLLLNPSQDNYLLRFVYKSDTIDIPVFPDFVTQNHLSIQRKNKRFFVNYKELLNKRIEHLQRVDSIYVEKQKEFQENLELFKFNSIEYDRTMVDQEDTEMKAYVRSLRIRSTGSYNIGKINENNSSKKYIFRFTDPLFNSYEVQGVILLDLTARTIKYFRPTEYVDLNDLSKYLLIAMLNDHQIGYIKDTKLKEITNQNGYEKIVQLNILNIENMTSEELQNILKE